MTSLCLRLAAMQQLKGEGLTVLFGGQQERTKTNKWPLELDLLLALLQSPDDAGANVQIRNLCADNVNWQTFTELVCRHRVWPLLHRNLMRLPDIPVPVETRAELKALARRNAHTALAMGAELVKVVRLLDNEGASVLSLKGPLLSRQLYGDLGMRPCRDLDLLLAPKDFEKTNRVLVVAGYKCLDQLPATCRSLLAHMQNSQHASYLADNGIVIEVHWCLGKNALGILEDFVVDWNNLPVQVLSGVPIKVLHDYDNFLYLCCHGAIHCWFRLRWLVDISLFIGSIESQAWPDILSRAEQLGVSRHLHEALALAALFFPGSLPGEVKSFMKQSHGLVWRIALTQKAMVADELIPQLSSAYLIHKCKRFLSAEGISKGRFLLSHLQPKMCDMAAVPLPDWLYPLYYLLRPFLWFGRVSGLSSQSKRSR